ncbi:lipoprotein, MAG6090 family [Mycoplasmopsis agalactiae]|uniref:lipoprotein, MAG6090 family n=1 Tax=Mycoplasmopsis agalactiae TaxID=2110 RepID=UPI0002EC264B|nr:hypothetical protein [Mycoplasmopsis agalactiae]
MKKKLLLSSGILALASPFISATCVVKNKTENDTPATAPAPSPVTPPAAEPVTPPNESPSVQPAPNPVNPPSNTEPTTPPNAQPSNPTAKDKLEKEHSKKHEEASSESTLRLFDDTYTNDKRDALNRIWNWTPFYSNISSSKDFTKEYKESLSKQKEKLLVFQAVQKKIEMKLID